MIMRFVYAVINLLILAGLIYLVGRKSIVKIFRSRRELLYHVQFLRQYDFEV